MQTTIHVTFMLLVIVLRISAVYVYYVHKYNNNSLKNCSEVETNVTAVINGLPSYVCL